MQSVCPLPFWKPHSFAAESRCGRDGHEEWPEGGDGGGRGGRGGGEERREKALN